MPRHNIGRKTDFVGRSNVAQGGCVFKISLKTERVTCNLTRNLSIMINS